MTGYTVTSSPGGHTCTTTGATTCTVTGLTNGTAYHFQVASDPRAGEWLLAAGERAQRAYAWLTAAERLSATRWLLRASKPNAPISGTRSVIEGGATSKSRMA